MGAGDVKLMAAVGALVGWERWFGIFFVTALIGGVMAMILVLSRGRLKKTLFNVGFILSEMKSGRPAYLANEELDVKNKKALGLPHGAVIAVSTRLLSGAERALRKIREGQSCRPYSSKAIGHSVWATAWPWSRAPGRCRFGFPSAASAAPISTCFTAPWRTA